MEEGGIYGVDGVSEGIWQKVLEGQEMGLQGFWRQGGR